MAASVRVEDEAFADLRYEALGKLLGTTVYDALGRMAWLWRQCTMQQKHVLPEVVVATIVDPDKVVAADLGERVEGGIRIRGTRGRIEWLAERRKAARKGGAANKAKWGAKRQPAGSSAPKPNDSPPAPAPAPAPAPEELDPPKGPPQGGGSRSRRKPRSTDPTPDEFSSIERVLAKLNERSEVEYRATTREYQEAILKRLRGGYTELDLRMVVWHQANRWAGDEAMAHNLNPTTLFKRQKFPEYVAQAKAAWRKEHGDQPPKLTLVGGGADVQG